MAIRSVHVAVLAAALSLGVVGGGAFAPVTAVAQSAQQQADALVAAAIQSALNSNVLDGAALTNSIASLLTDNPGLAGQLTVALSAASEGSLPGVSGAVNAAPLAAGLAKAVATWQKAGGSMAGAVAALNAVNAALASLDNAAFAAAFQQAAAPAGAALVAAAGDAEIPSDNSDPQVVVPSSNAPPSGA